MPTWKPVSRQIADEVWLGSSSISLTSAVESWLSDHGYDLAMPGLLDDFDTITNQVADQLQLKIKGSDAKGITPKCRFSIVDNDLIIAQIGEAESTVRSELVSVITSLSWRAFEHFCAHVMKANGVDKCQVTTATRDQGIDFVGLLDLGKIARTSVWHDVHLRVLGQAKHYQSTIGQEKLRLFCKDMEDFSKGDSLAFSSAPDWAQNRDMAQVGFVFTLKSFSQEAKTYAKIHSVALKDTQHMVQDLLMSDIRTPGLTRVNQNHVFDAAEFSNHFENLD